MAKNQNCNKLGRINFVINSQRQEYNRIETKTEHEKLKYNIKVFGLDGGRVRGASPFLLQKVLSKCSA